MFCLGLVVWVRVAVDTVYKYIIVQRHTQNSFPQMGGQLHPPMGDLSRALSSLTSDANSLRTLGEILT